MPDFLRSHGPKVAVGGLIVLNVVLLGALVLREPVQTAVPVAAARTTTGQPQPPETPTTASTTPGRSASARPSANPSPSPTPSLTSSPAPPPLRSPRLLAASSAQIAWRAEPSTCGQRSRVEVTTDGGKNWSPVKTGLYSVVRLKTYGDDAVFAVGADAKCRPNYAWSTGPGEPWRREADQVGDKWFRVPGQLDDVHAPGGKTTRPCGADLADLAGLGTNQAAALCADGRVRTIDEGRSWRTVQRESGLLALNADDGQFAAAKIRRGCPGVAVVTFDADGQGVTAKGDCRAGSTAEKGRTAVSLRSGDSWLWDGKTVTVT